LSQDRDAEGLRLDAKWSIRNAFVAETLVTPELEVLVGLLDRPLVDPM
jgi:hypothetical protein